MSNTLGFGLGINRGGAGYKYQSETVTLLRALTGSYSTPRKIEIDKMIKSLKAAGIWAKLDVFQMYAALNAADAVVNWKNPGTFNATLVNSPTLEADKGFTGDGASKYINTNFNASTAGGNFTQNSLHIGVYVRTNSQIAVAWELGVFDNFRMNIRETTDKYYARAGSMGSITDTNTNSSGFFIANRTGASVDQFVKNGSISKVGTNAAATLDNFNFFALAGNNSGTAVNFSTRQVAVISLGGGLTEAENAAYSTALETYLDYIGAGVIA